MACAIVLIAPLLAIGNHGWDHNHPDLGPGRGGFTGIQDDADCHRQVIEAARTIEQRAGRWPDTFAYPFGESSTALREHWFPARQADHRCRAALGTDPGRVHAGSDRWNLPRLVCGRDWADPDSLLQRLASP